jgi:hypothetical protein
MAELHMALIVPAGLIPCHEYSLAQVILMNYLQREKKRRRPTNMSSENISKTTFYRGECK